METMDTTAFILSAFRLVSATLVTGAAVYVGWELMVRKVLMPIFVWRYALIILTINAVFRWFVVWLLMKEQAELYDFWEHWVPPMTQTMSTLLVMVILVLTVTHVLKVQAHYRTHHDVEGLDE